MNKLIWEENKNLKTGRIKQYDLLDYSKETKYIAGSIWLSKNNGWFYETGYACDILNTDDLEEAKEKFQVIYRERCEEIVKHYTNIVKEYQDRLELLNNLEYAEWRKNK